MNNLKSFTELFEAKKKVVAAATKSDEPKKKKGKNNKKDYKFYTVNKETMKIVGGWEYKSDGQDLVKEYEEDKANKGKYAVYTKSYLAGKDIDVDSDSNWANS